MNMMVKVLGAAFFILHSSLFISCQDRDLPGSGKMQLTEPDVAGIVGTLTGENNYDYTLTWPASPQGAVMQVAVFKNGTQQQALTPCAGNSFTLRNLETNQLYEFLFKYANADALSNGVMTSFTRPGAAAASELKFEQIDINDDQHDLQVTWKASENATSYILKMVNGDGSRVISETVKGTSFLLKDVVMKERWEATLIAQNDEGRALPITGSAKIGGKLPAFLSEYATPEELIANGGDASQTTDWAKELADFQYDVVLQICSQILGLPDPPEDFRCYIFKFWSKHQLRKINFCNKLHNIF